jgi:hypothetical protein
MTRICEKLDFNVMAMIRVGTFLFGGLIQLQGDEICPCLIEYKTVKTFGGGEHILPSVSIRLHWIEANYHSSPGGVNPPLRTGDVAGGGVQEVVKTRIY